MTCSGFPSSPALKAKATVATGTGMLITPTGVGEGEERVEREARRTLVALDGVDEELLEGEGENEGRGGDAKTDEGRGGGRGEEQAARGELE